MELNKQKTVLVNNDSNAESRKQDHIELAFQSQIGVNNLDNRFYYEPLLAGHHQPKLNLTFLGKTLSNPIWVSSMTGGTKMAGIINENLARVCKDFGLGMGLGSCRALLYSDEHLKDFNIRPIIGDDLPMYANLGIAQLEELVVENRLDLVHRMLDKLQADGLIIHVNPMQEWLQPEGDRFKHAPIEIIERFLNYTDRPVIVKEVGQGMGYHSLKALFQLPLAAVEFAANGGTNFAKLELLRSEPYKQEVFQSLVNIGHSAEEMVMMANTIVAELGNKLSCKEVIISGGVNRFIDGYYLINKSKLASVYGQASSFLKHARGDYETLFKHVQAQIEGLEIANAFLRLK